MPSLKDLKNRIATTKATQRITQAMKMVAAAKLRRAQEAAEAARPYAERMERMLGSLAGGAKAGNGPKLLVGTGAKDRHLMLVISSDRGLCGGFNANLVRYARRRVTTLIDEERAPKLMIVGRKAVGVLRRDMRSYFAETYEDLAKPAPQFAHATQVAETILKMFEDGEFDTCSVIYNRFQSALTQIVTEQQLIPFEAPKAEGETDSGERPFGGAVYDYEPGEQEILADLLPRNLAVQVYRAMLESFASEQGARMTAMDSATRNAGDMINALTLTYNRTRQAMITKELIEIISGAEAV